jgi:hypothetical protein
MSDVPSRAPKRMSGGLSITSLILPCVRFVYPVLHFPIWPLEDEGCPYCCWNSVTLPLTYPSIVGGVSGLRERRVKYTRGDPNGFGSPLTPF